MIKSQQVFFNIQLYIDFDCLETMLCRKGLKQQNQFKILSIQKSAKFF